MMTLRPAILALSTTLLLGASAGAAPPKASVRIEKSTSSGLGGATPSEPDGTDVLNIPVGDTVSWHYGVTNTGATTVPFVNVLVNDDQTGVAPYFIGILTSDSDSLFEPGEV